MVTQSLHFASEFEINAGTVSLSLKTRKILLIMNLTTNETYLAKGRVDIDELSRHAALRNAFEETGLKVQLLPIKCATRAPPPDTARNERFWLHSRTIPIPKPLSSLQTPLSAAPSITPSKKRKRDDPAQHKFNTEPFAMQQHDQTMPDGQTIRKIVYWYVAEVEHVPPPMTATPTLGPGFRPVWGNWADTNAMVTLDSDARIARKAIELATQVLETRATAEKRGKNGKGARAEDRENGEGEVREKDKEKEKGEGEAKKKQKVCSGDDRGSENWNDFADGCGMADSTAVLRGPT